MNVLKFLKPALTLLIFGALAAMALGFTNEMTKDRIAALRAEAGESFMRAIMPEAESFKEANNPDADGEEKVYFARIGDEIIGMVVFATPNGFGGPIEVITAIDRDRTIRGVRLGTNSETPNLGTMAGEPEFYEQFTGLSIDTLPVVVKSEPKDGEILAISGATITSEGMTTGVHRAIELYNMMEEFK